MLCSEWSLVKANGTVVTVALLRCRCWSCEECSPIRKRQLMAQAHAGHPTVLLTLTVNPKRSLTPDERARDLAGAWRKLRKRAMRKYSLTKLPFIAVFEKTKRGEPHLHILLRVKWLSQKWLSQQMRDLIEAPIVDIRKVTGPSKIAAYIAKYIGKDPQRFVGTKRYWASQDWELPGPDDDYTDEDEPIWTEVRRCSQATVVRLMLDDGYTFLDETNGVVSLAYPPRHPSYLIEPPIPPPLFASINAPLGWD